MWTEPSWNGCRKEGFTTTQTVITYASKKDTYVIIIGIYSLIKHCMQARGFGDCHTRILCMVPLYQCTVKACKKKHRCCWCISQASYRHSYSYYYDHIAYLYFVAAGGYLVTHAVNWYHPLRALFHSCWSQLVDPEFEHLLLWQTIYTVLANNLYCT